MPCLNPLVTPLEKVYVSLLSEDVLIEVPPLIAPPTLNAPLIPTPPVTTNVPVVVLVLAIPAVNLVCPLDSRVVKLPAALVVTPILILLMVPAVFGLIVTVPLPVGFNVITAPLPARFTVLEVVNCVNAPIHGTLAPILTLSIAPTVFGRIATVPVPLGLISTVIFAPLNDVLFVDVSVVNVPATASVAPIITLSNAPTVAGLIVTVPVPVGWIEIFALT